MTALLRRVFSIALLAMLLGVAGSAAAVEASAAPAAVGSATKTAPTSYTPGHQKRGEHFTRYCVKHYKPKSTVKVVNKKTGQVVYIHTNGAGNGCAEVPVTTGCQKIVASGVDATGKPASSSATVCVLGKKVHRTHHSSGALPFTGSNIIISGALIGLALVGIGAALTMLARRRRAFSAA